MSAVYLLYNYLCYIEFYLAAWNLFLGYKNTIVHSSVKLKQQNLIHDCSEIGPTIFKNPFSQINMQKNAVLHKCVFFYIINAYFLFLVQDVPYNPTFQQKIIDPVEGKQLKNPQL